MNLSHRSMVYKITTPYFAVIFPTDSVLSLRVGYLHFLKLTLKNYSKIFNQMVYFKILRVIISPSRLIFRM